MATLVIDLQEGFSNDTVVVRVDAAEVFRKSGVSTNLVISRADSVEAETAEGSVDVGIELPARGLSTSVRVDVAERTYLTVNVEDEIVTRASNEEPYYL
jgi:hypothetical protein